MKKFTESIFVKTVLLIKEKPQLFVYTLLFDFIFFGSVFLLNNLSEKIVPIDEKALAALSSSQLTLVMLYLLFGFLLILLVYSICKYLVLQNIVGFFSKHAFNLKQLLKFCWLNTIYLIISLAVFLILNSFYIFSINKDNLPIVMLLTMIPAAALLYLAVNISHSLFITNGKVFLCLKNGATLTFHKFLSYFPVLLFLIVFYIPSTFVYYYVSTSEQIYLQAIPFILFYLMIAFNRMYIYNITKELK